MRHISQGTRENYEEREEIGQRTMFRGRTQDCREAAVAALAALCVEMQRVIRQNARDSDGICYRAKTPIHG